MSGNGSPSATKDRLDKSAYRFAAITLTIVMLAAGGRPIWIVGVHRFVEVSGGIAIGLMFTALWPEAELPRTLPSSECAGHVDTYQSSPSVTHSET
jgi:hypothetical protein